MSENQFEINIDPDWIKKYLSKIIIGLVVIVMVFSAVKTVGPEEEGVIIQLGEYNRTVSPGLSFIIPFVETMYKIPVQRQLKQEFGFRSTSTSTSGQSQYAKSGYVDESMMLTGDLNLTDVEWVVQYRIVDSYKYLFKVRNAEKTLNDMSESAMRKVVGDRTVNEVLTVGRQEIATSVELLLQEMCDEYENGIRVDQVVLQDVNPPEPVKPSFNAVNEAQQERETLINQAEADYNRIIPRARGEAEETIQLAEAYALNRVNGARGEAERFTSIFEAYIKSPEVTKQRIYLETLEKVLPKIGNKIITDERGSNVLPLLNINKPNVSTTPNP
ncbi:FtsH protease activity modulator HflK [Cyclobacterium amurskyense]|uniref:Protein HflK n=1 Tax=Cyclobacterium amurskyense TaxID=320787 RepID=A0A0H4P912_9BACT|nr:FtsH protease activity modulator HflK [Cyclobacterium amurskyense]AKP50639.1 HflK protein [Cyclobacterium amurskyense]|tara:strand:+ start:1183 stop:2172 length:990 start_codon:yes stop_codon:yes gene_type:complete